MEAKKDNTNRGAAWRNDDAIPPAKFSVNSENRMPQFTGNIDVEGKQYRLSVWTRETDKPEMGKNGKPLPNLTFAISEPGKFQSNNDSGKPFPNQNEEPGLTDDDIPF